MELVFDFFLILIECAILHCIKHYMPMWHMPGHHFDDDRYGYPFVKDTVTTSFLVKSSFIIPISLFIIFELMVKRKTLNRQSKLVAFVHQITKFACGILLMLMIGSCLKHVTGVPRPYYNAVCKPNITAIRELPSPYILDDQHICQNPDYHEAIRSFPSLHSAAAFYNAVYLALYMESRWTLDKPALLKPMLQAILLLAAIFVSCTRITDFKHHLSDVIAGVILGKSLAIFVVFSATDILSETTVYGRSRKKQEKTN